MSQTKVQLVSTSVPAGVNFSGIVTATELNTIFLGINTTSVTQQFQVGSGSTIVVIDSIGELGIGTTNPQYKLDVNGDINLTGTFRQNGSPFVASRWTAGTGNDIYKLNGNVGIGTTNPTDKLTVKGNTSLETLSVSGVVTATSGSFNLYNTVLCNYSELINDIGNTGAACTISLANGNYVVATLDQSTTFTFNTGITTGSIGFALQLTNGTGGPYTITWPASVKWPNNATPIRTTTDSKTDVWVFTSINNGTNWLGNLALYNYS